MGQVFLGLSPGGRRVAVKVIRPEHAADPSFRERFAREVEAARRVGGFHTAQVIDADPDAQLPWMATAYVQGPSLHQAIAQNGPMVSSSVRELGAALSEGLMAIHSCGLVHRDLKPGNVILGPDGPLIIDFGIARPSDSTALTSTGVVIGTFSYMSPEQIGSGVVGPASDVFSLGCVLVFAATGRGPFDAPTIPGIIHRVLSGQADFAGMEGDLRAIVTSCLAKDAPRRPGTAQLLALLGDGEREPGEGEMLPLANPPAPATLHAQTSLSQPQATGKAGLSRRTLLGGAVIALSGLAGGAAAFLHSAGRDRSPAKAPRGIVAPLWSTRLDSTTTDLRLAVADNTMLIHTSRGLEAFSLTDGQILWNSTTMKFGVTLPESSDEGLYLLKTWIPVSRSDPITGKELWTATLPGKVEPYALFSVTPSLVIVSDVQGAMHGLDARTGKLLWTSGAGRGRAWSPAAAVCRGSVLMFSAHLSTDSQPYMALDAATGKRRWSKTGHIVDVTLAGKEHVYLLDARTGIVALAPDSGRQFWTRPIETRHEKPTYNLSYAPGFLFSMIGEGETHRFTAFDAKSGENLWPAKAATDAPFYMLGNTLCYVNDGIHAIDAASGRTAWSLQTPGKRKLIGGGNDVFIVADSDGIAGINVNTGKEVWSSPLPANDDEGWKCRRTNELLLVYNKTGAHAFDFPGTSSALII